MSSWQYVADLASRLPDAVLSVAHEGSPAFYVGRHTFARLRLDQDREVLQSWTGDLSTAEALADRRDVFVRIDTFSHRVSTWAYLDSLEDREVAELVLDSYLIRGPVGRRGLDVSRYLDDPDAES